MALSLSIGLIAGTALATAAPLDVSGTNLSPAFVSHGELGAFHLSATNPSTSTSNISQLYLTELSGASVYSVTTSQGTCTTSGQLECSFGQLRVGETVTIDVALVAPGSGSTWNVDFEFSTTGYVIGKNKSHGDLFSIKYDIPLVGADSDSAGTYVWDATHQSIHNGLALGNSNKQSTEVTVFDTDFPASLQDGLTPSCITGSNKCPSSFFGEASEISVDNGANHLIRIVIDMYRPGVNPNQVNGIYHSWTVGTSSYDETITTLCPATGTPDTQCYSVTKIDTKNLEFVIWLFHNGRVMGW